MNVEELIAKFPSLVMPDNHHPEDDLLNDLCCPGCGSRDAISIVMTSFTELHPDGTGDSEDTEWDNESFCKCRACGHGAKVKDFTFDGLDELIETKIEDEKHEEAKES